MPDFKIWIDHMKSIKHITAAFLGVCAVSAAVYNVYDHFAKKSELEYISCNAQRAIMIIGYNTKANKIENERTDLQRQLAEFKVLNQNNLTTAQHREMFNLTNKLDQVNTILARLDIDIHHAKKKECK